MSTYALILYVVICSYSSKCIEHKEVFLVKADAKETSTAELEALHCPKAKKRFPHVMFTECDVVPLNDWNSDL